MSLHLYLAFIAASLIILVIPGPTIVLVIGQALAQGRRVAFASVAGVALGDLIATGFSMAGAGAILATSATLFQILKFAGAAYLVWLGLKMWRTPVALPEIPSQGVESEAPAAALLPVFRDSFLVTVLNPKGILFFVAFVPQFIDPAGAYGTQAIVYVLTFMLLGVINAAAYALLASSARRIVRRPQVLRAVTRTGGSLLIMAGAAAALTRRAG
ncbi:LysE family translocator [Pseudohoeflea suaedae]|uniref:LysE family translocator n=1 Tax=Pseudohoeflea suaedae TaxID=877384 RepID=A0A4R5PR55_9HYPH|nr:LysE family translocator [Pseudohoeflea suaedae]TDH39428.1 LysE family translocator [Pseudohoeflea suaedae]